MGHINFLGILQEVNTELNSQDFLLVLKFEGIYVLPFLEKIKILCTEHLIIIEPFALCFTDIQPLTGLAETQDTYCYRYTTPDGVGEDYLFSELRRSSTSVDNIVLQTGLARGNNNKFNSSTQILHLSLKKPDRFNPFRTASINYLLMATFHEKASLPALTII